MQYAKAFCVEKILRQYLKENNMFKDSMLFMCNEVCDRYKVTKDGIYKDNELVHKI